jgi:hypothetical protein
MLLPKCMAYIQRTICGRQHTCGWALTVDRLCRNADQILQNIRLLPILAASFLCTGDLSSTACDRE